MTSQSKGGPSPQEVQQLWEAGARSLNEGWRQGQEFWNNIARSWSEVAGAWMGQFPRSTQGLSADALAVWRELYEAAFAVGQAWMRLPLVLASGAQSGELQEAVTRLTEAQGRAYKIWMEALQKLGEAARPGSAPRPS
jgi:hypothetical protein